MDTAFFWAKYLLAAEAKKKICYMHNDLLSDSERKVNGKRPHRINLRGLFSVYHRFDKLVSVSKGTMELNRNNLIKYADYNKFVYVMNSINPDKILQSESQESEVIEKSSELYTENFKSRGLLRDINRYLVWNTLPGNSKATQYVLAKHFANAEIFISRKFENKQYTYYKFSYNNQIIGWIDCRAVELKPDTIFYEKKVNKIAKLERPTGNHIWSKPYKVTDMVKVSNSKDYKGVIFEIDREAKTQHSVYSRISINNTVIGWIDNSALKVVEDCTLYDSMKGIKKWKVLRKRKTILLKNYKVCKRVIDNIENRTLRENNINGKIYGKIANPENHTIWTKAYPNFGFKKVAMAKEFTGEVAKIITINDTKKGTYYLFEIENTKIGWLDSRAFDIVKDPVLLKEKEISYIATVKPRYKDYFWDKPYGLERAKKIATNMKEYNYSLVKIQKRSSNSKKGRMRK
ncbi:GW domain-containing glycosaminoglycan-binding protein [Virgibacillus halophilus]|uniref:GW domain-containing glycosaminoglycan-binding protein n=1 Tax=Tigheibacillus halophilus TaxID=361280 RepID=A0ABU5C4A5_9BACI|nr:GW domain-containing glycosaminoglycan-binding protein [Virgibacillus halophilus]